MYKRQVVMAIDDDDDDDDDDDVIIDLDMCSDEWRVCMVVVSC